VDIGISFGSLVAAFGLAAILARADGDDSIELLVAAPAAPGVLRSQPARPPN